METEDILEYALRPVVVFLTLVIPYTFLSAYFGGVGVQTQVKAELILVLAALSFFAVDYFLQNLLKQDLISKMVYIILILFFGYFAYSYTLDGYFVLLDDRTSLDWKVISALQAVFLAFWIQRTIKIFCQKMWDLDLT